MPGDTRACCFFLALQLVTACLDVKKFKTFSCHGYTNMQVKRTRPNVVEDAKKFITQGWGKKVILSMQMYQSRKLELSVQDGCLLWGNSVIILKPERAQILALFHYGHSGIFNNAERNNRIFGLFGRNGDI